MSPLPFSNTDVENCQEGDIRIHGINNENTSEILDAISSETAREILNIVYTKPIAASEVAEITNSSVQSVSYHLKKLSDAGVIEIVDTQYSEKGREMKVYGPADEPAVLFVGTQDRREELMSLINRFFGTVGIVVITSYLIGYFIEDSYLFGIHFLAASGDSPTLPIALAFLIGGLFSLFIVILWVEWRRYQMKYLR